MDSLALFVREAEDSLSYALDVSKDASGLPKPLNMSGFPDDPLVRETALRVTQLSSIRDELFKAFPFLEEIEEQEDDQHGEDPEC